LANPGRIRILETLLLGERSVGDLQPEVGLELSHLSQQLGLLRRAGLVTSRKHGAKVVYSISDPHLAELLEAAKRFLITSLTESTRLLDELREQAPR
jgi:ArsR family transcriptional regulator